MNTRIAAVLSTLLLSATFAQAQQSAEGTLLRWNFEEGKKFTVVMKQITKQRTKMPNREVAVDNNITTNMTWVVESVGEDGTAKMVQTIDRVRMQVESPMGTIEYDSNEQETPENAKQLANVFKPMIGKPITQQMNNRGEILSVEFPEGAMSGVNSNPQSPMTPEAIKEMTVKAAPVMPEGTAEPGFSWTKEGTSKTPVGTVTIKNDYTYKGADPTDAAVQLIDVKMEMQFDTTVATANIEVTEQSSEGVLKFNTEGGFLSASEMKQDMRLKIESGGAPPLNQEISNEVTMTVTPAS